jgi:hypothetical protein
MLVVTFRPRGLLSRATDFTAACTAASAAAVAAAVAALTAICWMRSALDLAAPTIDDLDFRADDLFLAITLSGCLASAALVLMKMRPVSALFHSRRTRTIRTPLVPVAYIRFTPTADVRWWRLNVCWGQKRTPSNKWKCSLCQPQSGGKTKNDP